MIYSLKTDYRFEKVKVQKYLLINENTIYDMIL